MQYNNKLCIFIDNANFMDLMSWQFLSEALKHKNIILSLAICSDQFIKIENDICENNILFHKRIQYLDNKFLPSLVCQFLNVIGLSKEFNE